ncbi:MAG: hypothetical protein ACK4GL_00455 [Flavobacteriales bacterium]
MYYLFIFLLFGFFSWSNYALAQSDIQQQQSNQVIETQIPVLNSSEDVKQKLANIDEHIRSIDIKAAHIRSKEETHQKALQDNYYERMDKIKKSLLERRAVLLQEMESKSE